MRCKLKTALSVLWQRISLNRVETARPRLRSDHFPRVHGDEAVPTTLKAIPVCALALWVFGSLAAQAATVAGLQAQLASGDKVTVIDIRSPEQFAQGHIPGAINVPASLCPHKHLPPLGKVVVCDGGFGRETTDSAVAALTAKPGLTVGVLEGGFSAWQNAHAPDTRMQGIKPGTLNYLSYAEVKAAAPGHVVLVDLRRPPTAKAAGKAAATLAPAQPLTDLATEFPHLRTVSLGADGAPPKSAAGSDTPPLLVLIDNGDGTAEAIARRLKAGGTYRYAILAGGELVVSRHGQAGLQRSGSKPALQPQHPAVKAASP